MTVACSRELRTLPTPWNHDLVMHLVFTDCDGYLTPDVPYLPACRVIYQPGNIQQGHQAFQIPRSLDYPHAQYIQVCVLVFMALSGAYYLKAMVVLVYQ